MPGGGPPGGIPRPGAMPGGPPRWSAHRRRWPTGARRRTSEPAHAGGERRHRHHRLLLRAGGDVAAGAGRRRCLRSHARRGRRHAEARRGHPGDHRLLRRACLLVTGRRSTHRRRRSTHARWRTEARRRSSGSRRRRAAERSLRDHRLRHATTADALSLVELGEHLLAVLHHLARRLVAARRVLLERFAHDAGDALRDVGRQRRQLGAQVHLQHRHRVVVVERHAAGQHLVAEDAERVEVATRVERQPAPLLGRHVLRRPEDDARLRLHAVVLLQELGDREVEQLHEVGRAGHVQEEHVVGLDVAVDDADRVRLGERRAALDEDLGDPVRRHRSLLDRRAQHLTVEELHGQEVPAVLRLTEVEHADRVRVLEPRACARLVGEALHPLLIRRHLRVQHLDGDDAIDRDLLRLVDDAHPAFADAGQDLVTAVEYLADERVLHSGVVLGARASG